CLLSLPTRRSSDLGGVHLHIGTLDRAAPLFGRLRSGIFREDLAKEHIDVRPSLWLADAGLQTAQHLQEGLVAVMQPGPPGVHCGFDRQWNPELRHAADLFAEKLA